MTLLPEIPEGEAEGETLDCYQALKAALPVRTINLIYRHLATIPDALPWAVSIVKELKAQAFLDPAAQSLAATPVPLLPPLAPQYWDQHGVDDKDRHRALEILHVYNWSNPRNLVVLQVMQHHLENPNAQQWTNDASSPAEHKTSVDLPANAEAELDPPAPPDALAPDILQMVQQTCRQLNVNPELLPTLHRHLGIMPNLYRALSATTENIVADGQVRLHAQRWEATAAELAALNRLTPTVPSAGSQLRIRDAISLFKHGIPVHCVLGKLWEERLGTGISERHPAAPFPAG
ncbi:hypothetical protein IV500_03940 [Paeniglutamicibacter antarcticus]|uniref:Uncharacterized protein n=1 Tax=Arthrobacter terrae TaxID=2935737 RepID=A0A931CHR6_9MICC|nr:hypothetical protein [Arthrobacter terrae]MBG0738573.1 hypothetical protein [Arthrobacter terrae]